MVLPFRSKIDISLKLYRDRELHSEDAQDFSRLTSMALMGSLWTEMVEMTEVSGVSRVVTS